MSDPYLGEVRMFGGNFAPVGWELCNGQLLSIAENDALYALLGTTYGGDGQTTFGVPDLRGRVPVHVSTAFVLGQKGGAETVALVSNQLPNHSHSFVSSGGPPNTASPANAVPAAPGTEIYSEEAPLIPYNPQKVLLAGGSLPHDNLQPYTCVSFIIATQGIFPSQG
jgi:microcystin-dependent protein